MKVWEWYILNRNHISSFEFNLELDGLEWRSLTEWQQQAPAPGQPGKHKGRQQLDSYDVQ